MGKYDATDKWAIAAIVAVFVINIVWVVLVAAFMIAAIRWLVGNA